MRLTTLVILFLLICLRSTGQVSCPPVKYYQSSFLHEGNNGAAQLLLLPGGSIMIMSKTNYGSTLLKLNSNGDTVWNKVYKTPDTDGNSICKVMLNQKNEIIALMNESLMKLDTGGNILSSRLIKVDNFFPRDMALLANNDIVVFFSEGFDNGLLARYSSDFSSVTWAQQINLSNAYFSNIVTDDNAIILSGSFSPEYIFSNNPFICRIDAATGNLLQLRCYTTKETESTITKLYKCGNGYIALGYLNYADPDAGRNVYMRFDKELNLLVTKRIKGYQVGIWNYSFVLSPHEDGSFYIAAGLSFDLSLGLVDKDDTILWMKDMPNLYDGPSDIKEDNDGVYITGASNFTGVATNTDYGQIFIEKCDLNGNQHCERQPLKQLKTSDYVFKEKKNNVYSIIPVTATTGPCVTTIERFPPEVNKTCESTATCNSVLLTGDTIVCNNHPVKFTGHKNKECSSRLNWSVSPHGDNAISIVNDSVAAITFTKSGNYVVYTSIATGCGELKDSLAVHVNIRAALNIGDDAFLCNNQPLTVHAGSQFKAYQWQDGSTDSNYTVTKPGRYYVMVTDYCNNQYADTIGVSASPDYSFSAGSDTSVCEGDSLQLAAGNGLTSYRWTMPGSPAVLSTQNTLTVKPAAGSVYFIQALTPYGCLVKDTVEVAVKMPLPLFIGNDTSFCNGDSVILTVSGFEYYNWNTGSSVPEVAVTKPGLYILRATAQNGCVSTDSLRVTDVFALPVLNLPEKAVICSGGQLKLDAGPGYTSYGWNTGSTAQAIMADTVDIYRVMVTDNHGCSNTDSTVITKIAALPSGFLQPGVEKCSYDTVLLKSNYPYNSYAWSTGAASATVNVTNAGSYWLEVTDDNGCINKEYTTVTEKQCYNALYFPAAFTPNSDGLNDVFRPKVYGSLRYYRLAIYNRFGQLVFSSANAAGGWDGLVKGQPQNTGTYVFTCSYQLQTGEPLTIRGTILLLH
ncbi:T9SS type B sorting domain-containing protein [Parafilimonas sp.]|uniref:gliding motility-associated C-terminal domain-containing protein n=1 Tax=Parafilimonas sp. TaxID=1969739 RepID=UPI003F7D3526